MLALPNWAWGKGARQRASSRARGVRDATGRQARSRPAQPPVYLAASAFCLNVRKAGWRTISKPSFLSPAT